MLLDTHRVYWCMQNAPAREESGMISSLHGHKLVSGDGGKARSEEMVSKTFETPGKSLFLRLLTRQDAS